MIQGGTRDRGKGIEMKNGIGEGSVGGNTEKVGVGVGVGTYITSRSRSPRQRRSRD